jgi:hypothetical protein
LQRKSDATKAELKRKLESDVPEDKIVRLGKGELGKKWKPVTKNGAEPGSDANEINVMGTGQIRSGIYRIATIGLSTGVPIFVFSRSSAYFPVALKAAAQNFDAEKELAYVTPTVQPDALLRLFCGLRGQVSEVICFV